MSESEHDAEFGLVLPFVVVESQGGPYRDDDYVAGYEAGRFSALLDLDVQAVDNAGVPVRSANLPQLDLFAMRNGYALTATAIEQTPEWSWISLEPVGIADTETPPEGDR